jgi:glycosyltransferase involved in cell wall biosynthesis
VKPLISIIVPTYNRLPILKLTLQQYENQKELDFPYELIVVDDGSSDETWDFLSTYTAKNFLFSAYRQTNQGPAQARNLAISKASGEYLIITGDDIIPADNFVAKHYEAHGSNPNILAVLGKTVWHPDLNVNSVMRHIDGVGAQQFSYYYLADQIKLDFRHFYTSNISIRRAELLRLEKLFDTDFHYAAYEDVELAYRLMGDAPKILYCADILGYHHHNYTIQGFARRQYCAGRMACLLKQKHPEVAEKIGFAELERVIGGSPKSDPSITSEKLQKWESTILQTFEKYIDSDRQDWLDAVYMGIFKYFYYKGMIEDQYEPKKATLLLPYLVGDCFVTCIQNFLQIEGLQLEESSKVVLAELVDQCSSFVPQLPNQPLLAHPEVQSLLVSFKLQLKKIPVVKNLYMSMKVVYLFARERIASYKNA